MAQLKPIQGHNWCMTLNDYTFAEQQALYEKIKTYMRYSIVGEEGNYGNMPHLQGYMQKLACCKLAWMKSHISSRAHWERANGTAQQNIVYCSKEDENPWIHGTPALTFKAAGKLKGAGSIAMAKAGKSWLEIIEVEGSYALQHANQIEKLIKAYKKANQICKCVADLDKQQLRPWQQAVWEEFQDQGPREILWLFDEEGNTGKTWFMKWIAIKMANEGMYMENGKRADLTRLWDYQTWITCNFTRDKEGIACYSFLESLKDGAMFSSKYEPETKMTNDLVRVIVSANWLPEFGKLSIDRWKLIEITTEEDEETVVLTTWTKQMIKEKRSEQRDIVMKSKKY